MHMAGQPSTSWHPVWPRLFISPLGGTFVQALSRRLNVPGGIPASIYREVNKFFFGNRRRNYLPRVDLPLGVPTIAFLRAHHSLSITVLQMSWLRVTRNGQELQSFLLFTTGLKTAGGNMVDYLLERWDDDVRARPAKVIRVKVSKTMRLETTEYILLWLLPKPPERQP